jgi:hypothetical protein
MATMLTSNESFSTAENRLNAAQRDKFDTFIASLKADYPPGVVENKGNNINIDLNDYIKNNKDKVYDEELTKIKTSINNFCSNNSKFSNTYVTKEAAAPVVEEVEDGRRRKTKRSPSKKSIKSKRKY